MGQSSSTQRDRRHSTPPEHFLSFHTNRARLNRNEEMNNGHNLEQTGEYPPQSGTEIDNDGTQTGTAQLNSAGEIWQPDAPIDEQRQMRTIQEENGSQYEPSQREYRSAIFARMAARRQSTMSRLGSRILPNSVIRGLLSSEEETPAEGHAHRHGIVSRSIPRSETTHSSARFSPFSSLGSRGVSRRRSLRGPYFIPRTDPSSTSDAAHSSSYLDPATESSPEPTRSSWRRSARLNRVRNSLSGPITHMFGQSSSNMSSQEPGTTLQPPLDPVVNADPDGFLPYSRSMDSQMDFDEPHELDSVEPAVGSTRPTSPMSSQSSQGPSGLRQFPGLLRARPSRVLRREEQTPLSRVLQLAAAAIAAQLSENFIQSLQHATSTQATPNDAGGIAAGDNAPPTPVNFLRVFRFANSDGARPAGQPSRSTADSENAEGNGNGMDVDNPTDGPEGRTVTLVVVGVRSVPSGNGPSGDQPGNAGTGLDALLRLPFLSPGNLPRNQDNGPGLTPRAEGRPRFSSIRPQSEATSGLPTSNDASQGGIPSPLRRMSDTGSRVSLGPLSSAPSVPSESPPGPHPPPSTPAEAGLSAVSSSASTPSRRPSAVSAMSPGILPHLDASRSMQPTVEDGIPLNARQRRRSDSEYARHRDLGSGAVRRNGVVEPDNATPPTGRSWLIYVVGTNLSENHPAFATPSLFTDNPTYEDMILLSSLLGPVKPPVASQDDLTTAGGLFRLVEYAGSLVAEALEGAGTIQVPEGERCLICLSDYEVAEELRQLNKCQHLFHRDCIDQWLTTGRNSCPLCRGQGVAETAANNRSTSDAPNAAAA
ncbi:RING finger protein [Aspergillus ellipticus CBS 707.79]|uniref:RING-type E3 ubiquitin transferase n=1 Tax=Aspergillus ellipticus CBS 707.79 TaxID=1448320 RepID=A0A319DI27_9EURO|nr:RING finger protein [Aspergillus ellipticus CBS 707.79]